MIRLLIACSLIACSLSIEAQTTQKLTANKLNEYGLIYTLPTTVADVTIETEKTERTPGEFHLYAKKYLGLDPITESSVVYTLKSVAVNPRGVANSDERYLVQFKSGSTPFMILNDMDFPLSINTESTISVQPTTLPVAQEAQPTILQSPAATQAVTAEMLQSPSSAKRAELAANRIFELRQSRSEIISGTADNMPSDGQAMQLALDNLAAQEEALTAMFIGTVQQSTQVNTISVDIPADSTDVHSMVVARISALEGLVDADNLTGDPIKITFTVTERGQLPKNEKQEVKRFPKGGFAYRIPGSAVVTTEFMGQQISSDRINVAQLGVVFGLDPNLFTDKKAPAYAKFDPITGAILELGTVTP
ncbi:MAG: DUF4831 family protein [Bacteroides sp.]|nr:DUF4831 family protein [Bacteroides sp.]MCM1413715.1 DUF4831 family protein [Bacteroides sp.]MCM1471894.1 DUF4831 family protein [Bacteroides sp.]